MLSYIAVFYAGVIAGWIVFSLCRSAAKGDKKPGGGEWTTK